MEILSKRLILALTLSAGLFTISCNNSTTTTTNEGSNKPDTTLKKTEPAAPAGKVANGADIEVHAVGNTMAEMHYDVSEMHVPANTAIKITLTNDGTDAAMQHNVVISKPEDVDSVASEGQAAGMKNGFVPNDKARVIAASGLTAPGAKTVLSFKTPEKGEYKFFCTYPGHYKQMQGKFIVE